MLYIALAGSKSGSRANTRGLSCSFPDSVSLGQTPFQNTAGCRIAAMLYIALAGTHPGQQKKSVTQSCRLNVLLAQRQHFTIEQEI